MTATLREVSDELETCREELAAALEEVKISHRDIERLEEARDASVGETTRIISISKVYTDHGTIVKEEAEEEKIPVKVPPPDVPMASVRYSGALTVNLGHFESMKISVGIDLPTPLEELPNAFEAAKKFVADRLVAITHEVDPIREKEDE